MRPGLSIRQFARETGFSYGTARNVLLGLTRNPRPQTIARLENWLSQQSRTTERNVGVLVERARWSQTQLLVASPPAAARQSGASFRLVYHASDMPGGFASTGWQRWEDASPLDVARAEQIPTEAVTQVVWEPL